MELPINSRIDEFNYGIKSTLAQVLALSTSYLLTMKLGIDQMTPSIIIGAVTDSRNNNNNSLSKISEEQSSWIGSILYLFPPVGSVFASLVQDRLGHRTCMILANVTHLLSIAILLFADTPKLLYAVTGLMGFNVGFINSVTISYCGEVCDPKLRGLLLSVCSLFYFAGYLFITTSYAITADWKLSVLFTVAIPVVNAGLLFQTPDSPMWLLSKNRKEEAKQTFKKLRGGASEENCIKEFQDMILYTSKMDLIDSPTKETKSNSLSDSFYNFIEPETLKPFQMLVIITFFNNVLSGQPFVPYLMSVFDTFKTPLHSAWSMTINMTCGVLGNVVTIIVISRIGKRTLTLSTMASSIVCYTCIGIVGRFWSPSLISSWIQLVLFFVSSFFSSMGFVPVMWILYGELYPMKTKNMGAGISSAMFFITCFLMTKFYRNFETLVGFYNTFIIFGVLGVVGFIYIYYKLPETENKTLNEISANFKRKSTKINIQRT
ncbi:Sugar transporter, conserved site,Major facilitator superfamily domain,Major facilitator, sugar [Cinara cedri]|uniref:Sugar transporter, conserved site,Major facilitator superfamily domain,Major facilitator, sugar n=1 Tax=Cinara cedri TaxID=506608 RepID=A0A5E4N4J8_9HEMI|nr:Sugar transporter, conserved site,Major facilitator superfamily domain,Major facilitator, sugar [Cinara cedri]